MRSRAGALLAELLVRKRIELVAAGRKRLVRLVDAKPIGEALLDESLRRIAEAKRRATVTTWVARFTGLRGMRDWLAERLCQLGILRAEETDALRPSGNDFRLATRHRVIAKVENSRTAASIPAVNLDWRRREYTAPNQDWTLVLHSSFEWHMGATGWKGSLLRAGKDVSRRHKGILRIGGTKGFQCPDDFQPWAFDSRVLALVTWRTEHPILLYELERSSWVAIHSGKAFPRSVQSAPDLDRLLISFSTYGAVYDQRGVLRFTVPWQVPDSEAPFVFWTRGGRFLWLGRESPDSATLIRVYSGLDGAVIAAQPLDPADAVPYDRQRYRNISRRTFTLRRGRGLWAVGSLLDCWNQVRFDPSSNRMLLSVLRPVSEPHQGAPSPVCDVEERWVEATITLP